MRAWLPGFPMARKCGRTFFAVRGETSPSMTPSLSFAPGAAVFPARFTSSSQALGPPATIAAAPAMVILGVGVSGPWSNASRPTAVPRRLGRGGTSVALPAPPAPDSADDRTVKITGSDAVLLLLRDEIPRALTERGAWLRGVVSLLASPPALPTVRPPASRLSAAICGQVPGRVALERAERTRDAGRLFFLFSSMAVKIRRTSSSYLSCETRQTLFGCEAAQPRDAVGGSLDDGSRAQRSNPKLVLPARQNILCLHFPAIKSNVLPYVSFAVGFGVPWRCGRGQPGVQSSDDEAGRTKSRACAVHQPHRKERVLVGRGICTKALRGRDPLFISPFSKQSG